jgi:hypothetical protein
VSIETRLKKLEGPMHHKDHDEIDLIFLVGIRSQNSEDYDPEAPVKLLAYCLHPECPCKEHVGLPNEAIEQLAARLQDEHLGA